MWLLSKQGVASKAADRPSGAGLRLGVAAVGLASSLVLGGAAVAASSVALPRTGTSVIVKISASRGGFTNVLTNDPGRTLYTAARCNASCLSSWPPLLMPRGKTVPLGPHGLTGLGTAKFGTRLQVTFHRHRLYTFTGDTGSSVNGNGVTGFTVIKNA